MSRPTGQDGLSSLTRGLNLLNLFSVQDNELSISELARRSGIPKSTTHRLVSDLVDWGALERGHYGIKLGGRLFELGQLVPLQRWLRELAIPYAHNLNEVTQLTSNLAIRDGIEIVYVEKIVSRKLRVPHSRTGGRLPLHCTALGKSILAFSDPDFVDQTLLGSLATLTPKTITDPKVLRAQLDTIRGTKIAYDVEESQAGLFCVASPVFAQQNVVVGAISVTGAAALAEAHHFAPAVRATAQALSRTLESQNRMRLS